MDILKLFSALSNLFDTPPKINQPPKKEEKVKTQQNNKAHSFMSYHEQLSKRIKQQNKKG